MNQQSPVDLDAVFAALANRHRRQIVDILALRPASISEVAERVGLSLTAINRHLTVLEDAQVMQRRKSGRTTYLAIRRSGLLALQGWVGGFTPTWGTDSESLDNYVAALTRTTHHDDREENAP